MSKQLEPQEMVQRILAVAEILSTVATPEEIRTANVDKVSYLCDADQASESEVQK